MLSGCVTSGPEPAPAYPPRSLAATPEPLEPEESVAPSPTTNGSAGPTGTPKTTASTPAPTFRSRARVIDPSGDAGLRAPAYADLASVVIESDGMDVRVTVDVRANLSTSLAEGEVMGIGVDFYRDAEADESDFQLFADGGDDGWFAYLQTPQGFVEYPGSFRLGGGRLVFQVPMDSVGDLAATATSSFLDWSRPSSVVNDSASDVAPNSGRARIDR